VSGSIGDVPLLYIHDESLSNRTSLNVVESRRGSADFISEVQVFERIDSGSGIGHFHLQYNSSLIILQANASAEDFRLAVASLTGLCQMLKPCVLTDDIVVKKIASMTPGKNLISNQWIVTFPRSFGRAFLLQVYALCTFSNDIKYVNNLYTSPTFYVEDYWEGSSCLLPYNNKFNVMRIVPGYSSLSGKIDIYSQNTYNDIRINSLYNDLNRVLPTAHITQFNSGIGNLTKSYYLYFPSNNVSLLNLKDSLNIIYPYCGIAPEVTNDEFELYLSHRLELNVTRCYFPFKKDNISYSSCVSRPDSQYSYCPTSYSNNQFIDWRRCPQRIQQWISFF
jgi:hypothetical protein